ncbi:terminase small subunit [Oenococcus oeni]|uniref:Phage terminase small subunit n=2 Tax=Sozzivirus TaxID=2843458 RepID=V5URT8_9CAUD|nr:terminase small subunit [Oenococcus oeni]YP_009005233.1 terminase small subunit [Oenococcus phage phiS13]YP_009006566.1 terminase small subunit [Oenococcus phage phiS11]AHB80325.1 Phage terminase small subunit [Oenococcus phage phiS11]AHB80383.1 Phage terminase small subunit [Oenococcus phage phiS13]KGH52433.1 terminase [Oenococcus oeni S11]KGH62518.1 terminase [Oenococcus oeni S13]MDS0175975.1 terminase small subunit [Oenococcus oeni]
MTKQEEARQDYLNGMKYKDIAEKYAVSLNTVKSWKKRNNWQRGAPKEKRVRKKVAEKINQSPGLTDKQRLFCLYYLQRYNATWAYQKAYEADYDVANVNGPRMLVNTSVKSLLTKLKQQQSADLYLNANDILKEFAKQATANLGDYLDFGKYDVLAQDEQGNIKLDSNDNPVKYRNSWVQLKNKNGLDTSLIKSVHIGKDGVIVELYDKQRAMKELLDRLPEPEIKDKSDDGFLRAIDKNLENTWKESDRDET